MLIHMTITHLARLVRDLRTAQRSGGRGYKDQAAHDKATALEQQVDKAVHRILHDGGNAPAPKS
jgi:hypothetical protein